MGAIPPRWAKYSAVECTSAKVAVLKIFAFAPHSEPANFLTISVLVLTFFAVSSRCVLKVRVRSDVTQDILDRDSAPVKYFRGYIQSTVRLTVAIVAGKQTLRQFVPQHRSLPKEEMLEKTCSRSGDLNLVMLASELEFSDEVKAIALPSEGEEVPEGTRVTASGWGITKTNSDVPSNVLREVNLTIVNNEACQRKVQAPVTKRMICATGGKTGKDTCESSVPRIYLPRHMGGRGLLSLERLHNRVVLATACNVTRSNDPLIRLVREHENAAAKRAAEELSITLDFTRRCQQSITELAPAQLKTHIKAAEPMHGIFYKHLEEHGLSEQLTFSFLRSSGLKSETEGFIMACQDGVVNTLVYRGRVMGMNVPDTRCRACRQAPETLMHLLSACKTYAGTAYVHRHNAALRVLYYHLRHSYGIDETPVLPYAPGDIESVVENERCRIYRNYSFPTLELVQANKPDVVLLDHQQKTMFEEEKRTKYQELLGQLRRLWPDYTVSLLVMVIGSLGRMRNTLLSALRAIPVCRAAAHILAARMQKAVILGSLRLLRAHDTRTQ
nr:unnamed protein product [Callosobruchus analis]